MERKIILELCNITLSEPMFIGDSEIVLKMIARNDPAGLATTIEYMREVGGRTISVNRSLCHLYPFMNLETAKPQERITSLDKDGAVGTTAPGPNVPKEEIHGEISNSEH